MKYKNNKYDYGECEVCGAQMEEKSITQDFWINDDLIIVQNIPAGVCPRCGEKVVKADVGQRIENLIQNSERIADAPKISVPTLKYDAEEANI